MGKKKHKRKNKTGLIPGSIVYTGQKESQQLFIEVFDYKADNYIEENLSNIEDTFKFKSTDAITWINVNGLNHVDAIEKLGNHYDIHPLVLEDIVNISQRPKIDEYENYLYVVLKMLYIDTSNNDAVVSEQINFVLGDNYLLSFHESDLDIFDMVKDRIRTSKGRVRDMGADYLLYILMDTIVDHYVNLVDVLGDTIEDFESDILAGNIANDASKTILNLKREVLRARRIVFPSREVINRIEKNENNLIGKNALTFYRDIYDHLVQVCEDIDVYREMVSSLMDMYMSSISNKMNEVMKVLTIMASIFIPLTFIAGVYGMNFEYMPELKYHNAYYIVLGIMAVILIGMILYFKRKKWL
ncbi:magnesium/cobalt transporter CorA [Gaetbulibacter aestuarii]|uniref:Magnesium transport protein CorA n=1 Tax=Gaetbulibacter aestuarii TaxID=1502358 RepID=A0ABW7MZ25_9FLAO